MGPGLNALGVVLLRYAVLCCVCGPADQRAEHEKKRAIEKAVRLAAQAQAAGADLKDLKLPASLQPATKSKPKK